MKQIDKSDIVVPIGSMNKRSFIALLGRLLGLSRHYGVTSDQLFIFITNKLKRVNLNEDLKAIHRELYDSIFRSITFTPWEKQGKVTKWSCMIEYGIGRSLEGIGDTPEKAFYIAKSRVSKYLEGLKNG